MPWTLTHFDEATVVLDADGVTTRHEDVEVTIYDGWVRIKQIGEVQFIPRERVEEVFSRS